MIGHHHNPTSGQGPWAGIAPQAIRQNLLWLKRRLQHHAIGSRAAPVWAVVKADAYGHGLEHALQALDEADGASVANLDDALRLRRLGWSKPILVLSIWGLQAGDLCDRFLGELHVVVDDEHQLATLEAIRPATARLHAWLRFAGQLRSQGFAHSEYRAAFHRLLALVQSGTLIGAGHLHHYAASEDAQALQFERQSFACATAQLPGPYCTANSAALCGEGPGPLHEGGHWLRCGLLLYGASALPPSTGPELGLQPAMNLHARLLARRFIRAGEAVGYGDSFRAKRDTCIGTVGIGYGHGVPRNLWKKGSVLVGDHGRRVPLAGRVAMDCLTVDLGPSPAEQVGDIVTIWGSAPNGAIRPVEAVAHDCDTIAAELLTSLTARVPLVPVN